MDHDGGGRVDVQIFFFFLISSQPSLVPPPSWAVQRLVGTNVSLCNSSLLRISC